MRTTRIVAGLAIAILWTACENGAPAGPEEPYQVAGVFNTANPQPAGGGILYACYNPSGSVYRIRAPGLPNECKGNDVEFSWSEQGQEGPPGSPGSPGADGVSGWELKNATATLTTPFLSVNVSCTPGKKVLSGGSSPFADVPGNQSVSVEANFPSPVLQDAWIVALRSEPGGINTKWNVWAICASVT